MTREELTPPALPPMQEVLLGVQWRINPDSSVTLSLGRSETHYQAPIVEVTLTAQQIVRLLGERPCRAVGLVWGLTVAQETP